MADNKPKPTEEQMLAAEDFILGRSYADDEDVAQLLAEREAKLTTSIMTMWVAERAQLNERFDTMRAELQERIDALEDDTVICEGCGKRLPHACAIPTEDPVYLCARCVSPMHMERAEQTRACVDALEEQMNRFTPGDGFDSGPIEKLRELYPRVSTSCESSEGAGNQ